MSGEIKTSDLILFKKINDDFYVLLTKRHSSCNYGGDYCVPGGHLDENESWKSCALRELAEETNVDLSDVKDDVFLLGFHIPNDKGRNVDGATYVYFVENDTFKYIPQENEVVSIEWHKIDQMPDNIAFGHDEVILEALQLIQQYH